MDSNHHLVRHHDPKMINPGEHVSIFGMTGSGKSTLTRQISEYFPRQVIFDRKREWKNVPEALYVYDYNSFAKAYQSVEHTEHFRIIVQFRLGISSEELDDNFGRMLHLLYIRESSIGWGLLLLIEEVWVYSSPHYLNPWLKEAILTGRDPAKITVLVNSQRPASTHKDLPSQSHHVFVGMYFDPNDGKYFREVLGPENCKLAEGLPKYNFVWFRPGHGKPTIIQTTEHQ